MSSAEEKKEWPLYFTDCLSLGKPESNVGICTLWSKQEKVRNHLDGSLYSIMGNLYSVDGINYLLRNVLANPRIRYVVLCGIDVTGSGQTLIRLFDKGIDERHRVKGTEAAIDDNLDAAAIDLVRKGVKLIDMRGPIKGEDLRGVIEKLDRDLPAFHDRPLYFPELKPDVEVYPDYDNARVIRAGHVVEAWVKIIDAVMTFGRMEKTQYSLNQKEILNLVTVITKENPDNIMHREWLPFDKEHLKGSGDNTTMKDGAWVQYRLLLRDPEYGYDYGKKYGYYDQLASTLELPDISYTYGDRLFHHYNIDQISEVINKLINTSYSRRAVAVLWDPEQDASSENPPCLNLLQATIRGEKLHFTAYFRSHDVYRAWPENAFGLRRIQQFIANRIWGEKGAKSRLGDLVIFSQSAHIYEDCWSKATQIIKDRLREFKRAKYFQRDARGSFVIRLEGGLIRVFHYSPQGNLLNTFEGKNAEELLKSVEPYVSLTGHALYLGREMARAEAALKLNLEYRQDQGFPV